MPTSVCDIYDVICGLYLVFFITRKTGPSQPSSLAIGFHILYKSNKIAYFKKSNDSPSVVWRTVDHSCVRSDQQAPGQAPYRWPWPYTDGPAGPGQAPARLTLAIYGRTSRSQARLQPRNRWPWPSTNRPAGHKPGPGAAGSGRLRTDQHAPGQAPAPLALVVYERTSTRQARRRRCWS